MPYHKEVIPGEARERPFDPVLINQFPEEEKRGDDRVDLQTVHQGKYPLGDL